MATSINSSGVTYTDSTTQTTQYGNKQLISELTASSSASLSFSFSNTYNHYELIFNNLIPVTQSVSLYAYLNVGGAYRTTLNYYYMSKYYTYNNGASNFYGTNAAYILLSYPTYFVNYSYGGVSGRFTIFNCRQTSKLKNFIYETPGYYYTTGYYGHNQGGGFFDSASVSGKTNTVDGIQFIASSGNLGAGSIACYGFN